MEKLIKFEFCVYLTMYKGELLPKWYIGSSSIEKIRNGYNGSIKSIKWKDIYSNEQNENKHLFKTRILSTHETRKQALEEELRVQKLHLVRDNPKYFNASYATVNGYFGSDVSGKLNPFFGKKHKKETIKYIQEKFNDIDSDGFTTREKANKKMSQTKNSLCDNGLTNAQNASIKGAHTRKQKF